MPRVVDLEVAKLAYQSGQLDTHVEIREVGSRELLLSTRPEDGASIKVTGGSITTDETRSINGGGSIEVLVDDAYLDIIPTSPNDILSPVRDSYVQISYGSPGGTIETEYGAYEISEVDTRETAEGIAMTISFWDFGRKVQRARFTTPLTLKNKTHSLVIYTLLENVLVHADLEIVDTHHTSGTLTWDEQDDRLEAVRGVATSVGYRLDFNHRGRGDFFAGPDSELADDPVYTFIDGGNATVFEVGRNLSDEKSYNGVIARGESTGSDKPPVRAEAWDTNPLSPTYYDPADPDASNYGPVPFFYSSQYIVKYSQALAAARSRLPKVMGLVEVLDLVCPPNPGVKEGDPILVERPKLGASGTYIVQATDMPVLPTDSMKIRCRERRLRFDNVYPSTI